METPNANLAAGLAWLQSTWTMGSAEAKAERIIAETLGRLGWKEADLATRRKSDPVKLGLAARLRRETTLTIKAIAARLHLGTSKSANARIHETMRGSASPPAQTRLAI